MKPRYDFSDRTVFVSGGTSGINLGIAKSNGLRTLSPQMFQKDIDGMGLVNILNT